MSNLGSAQAAIQEELAHAKQGLAFYQSRVAALEATLAQLATLDGKSNKKTSTKIKGRVGRPRGTTIAKPAKSAGADKPAKTAKAPKKSARSKKLPFTGGNFWINLISDQPQSNADILDAAIASLGITPSDVEIKKLAQRMTFALNAMVKTKTIQDSGSGRERRFFKA